MPSINLSYIKNSCIGNAKNRTRGCWVRSASATSMPSPQENSLFSLSSTVSRQIHRFVDSAVLKITLLQLFTHQRPHMRFKWLLISVFQVVMLLILKLLMMLQISGSIESLKSVLKLESERFVNFGAEKCIFISYSAGRIQVRWVAPDWDHSDAPPTELQRHG